MMSSMKSTGLPLLVLLYLLYIADSHPNTDLANLGCECTLKRNTFWSKYVNVLGPIYQCQGCCFSRAFPTPLKTMKTMSIPKNITSEASCCVAQHHNEIQFDEGITVNNHTSCHCSTCFYHKQ